MDKRDKKRSLIRSLPRTFWVANLMELFERGAYYGMNAVLAVYLVKVLNFSEQSVGFLQGFVYALTYIMPIIGGALAERLGYRKMLIAAFSLLSLGYFAAGNFDSYGLIFLFLLIMATGSGLFKPIITGTVARTTTKENSGFGFGVYYWSINLGAFLAPFFVSWIRREFRWEYVFFASALWCFLMLLPAIFLYKDPQKPESTKSIRHVIKEAFLVLRNSRFVLMILVYSCFWVLYFQNFGSVLWYLRDFIVRSPVDRFLENIPFLRNFKFDVEFVTIINAGTIILLVVLISRIVKNFKALPVMAAGIVIGAGGFVILAFTNNAWMFILGIAVFSLGEMTAHPKYYSYVGIVAPQDKKAVYMGYAFLYGVFGSLFGSNLGGILYEKILKPFVITPEGFAEAVPNIPYLYGFRENFLAVLRVGNHDSLITWTPEVVKQVRLFWLVFAVLGILCLIGILMYNKYFSKDTPETNRRARKIMLGIYFFLAAAGIYFLIYSLLISDQVLWKTFTQSLILLGLGGGGVAISLKKESSLE